MKKRVYFGILAILCVISIAGIGISAIEETTFHWYCTRNKVHKQPIADQNMRFIEEMDGYYIDHFHGDQTEEKVIYLTFDAGYENGNIERVLNTLTEEQVTGTFFILGNLLHRNPSLSIAWYKKDTPSPIIPITIRT
jgi:peptidoglycan-N-acetylmuramic acid deacetylase